MAIFLQLSCIVVLFTIYLKVKPKLSRVGPYLPDSFLIGIAIYTIGALYVYFVEHLPAAEELVIICGMVMSSALLGCIFFALLCAPKYRALSFSNDFVGLVPGAKEHAIMRLLLLLSAVLCVVFVYFVLSNSTVAALLNVASIFSDSTLLDARKAITSGTEGYFAPGYIKQFRDIIIPILVVALMSVAGPKNRHKVLSFSALMAASAAMVLSGQRLVFVILFLTLFLGSQFVLSYRARLNPMRRKSGKGSMLSGIAILALVYGVLTVLLGRVDEAAGATQAVVSVFTNLIDRIFVAPPHENVLTYPVWNTLGPTYGASWAADLSAIMPGAGESFSNILHSASGGSLQGNSPLGMPADIWFAWGWLGCILVPVLFAVGVGYLDLLLLTERSVILFATRCYLFVVLPICYSPYLFVLYGGAVAAVFIIMIKVLRKRSIVFAPFVSGQNV